MDTYLLPHAHVMDIIARPSIVSLIFVHHENDFSSFRVRYMYGMRDVFCTKEQVNLLLPPQSLSVILHDAFFGFVSELQRVLNNQRQNQEAFSSFSMNASIITWDYLVEKLQIPVEEKAKICTFLVSSGKDLSITKVKAKYTCRILQIEDSKAISRLISIFGLRSVIGVRKKPPKLAKKLRMGQTFVATRGGVQLLDVINLVDVNINNNIRRPQTFTFNANGRKGIDFIYIPELKSMRIFVRYKKYIVQDAIVQLRQLGVMSAEDGEALTDDEVERLIRG
jgi:hypothetical protein